MYFAGEEPVTCAISSATYEINEEESSITFVYTGALSATILEALDYTNGLLRKSISHATFRGNLTLTIKYFDALNGELGHDTKVRERLARVLNAIRIAILN